MGERLKGERGAGVERSAGAAGQVMVAGGFMQAFEVMVRVMLSKF